MLAEPAPSSHRLSPPRLTCGRCSATPRQRDVAFSCAANALIHTAPTSSSTDEERVICGGRVTATGAGTPTPTLLRPGRIVRAHAARQRQVHRVRLGEPVRTNAGSWDGTALCGYAPPEARPYWLPLSNQTLDDHSSQACGACEDRFAKLPDRARL